MADNNDDFDFNDLKKKPENKKHTPLLNDITASQTFNEEFTDRFVKDPKRLAMLLDLFDKLPKEHKNKLIEQIGKKPPFTDIVNELSEDTSLEKLKKKIRKLEDIRKHQLDNKPSNTLQNKILEMLNNTNLEQKNNDNKQISDNLVGSSKTSLRKKKKKDKYRQKQKQKMIN